MKGDFKLLFKTLLIGDASVGKSCLLTRFSEDKFTAQYLATIGVDFASKMIPWNGDNYKLQVWDTAGQERFRAITRAYYRGAAGALLVYDITDRLSFDHLQYWHEDLMTHADPSIAVIIVGTKSDLSESRVVSVEEGDSMARKLGALFMEVSSLENTNVDRVFQTLLEGMILRRESS
jgi:small GTP-binding protein